MEPRRYRAGESIEDFCRACKTDRMHTVVAADGDGRPIRVDCGYCHSEHNFRGGARIGGRPEAAAAVAGSAGGRPPPPAPPRIPAARPARGAFPLVSDPEKKSPPQPPG